MKTQHLITFMIVLFLFACSNTETKTDTSEQEQTAPATSDLMKEEPAYNPVAIDPNAQLVEITLNAQGNTMTDIKFDMSEIRVPAGSTVKIKFINESTDAAMIHNFVLIEEGSADTVAMAALAAGPAMSYVPAMKEVLYGSKLLNPKEETEFTIPAPAKGVYDFLCTFPGHYKIMHGKFIVE